MSVCFIPVSIGELFDKYTILEIKLENIQDMEKKRMVKIEIDYLQKYVEQYNLEESLIQKMKSINKKLWDIEDQIRCKEKNKEFDEEFIQLARLVYITNDERSRVKNEINSILKSDIMDIKSYAKY